MSGLLMVMIRALYIGLFTGIIIALPLGPASIESVRITVLKGFKKGIMVVLGALTGDFIDVMLINFGLLNLIETNRILEVIFWLLSGLVIFFIGYRAIKSNICYTAETEEKLLEKKEMQSRPFLTGFIINISNPMTHFFWLTISSTVIRTWRSSGRLPYFIFTVSMLSGMFISLWCVNFLAAKGKKFSSLKFSGKFSSILAYGITAIGIGFFLYGLYRLYSLIKI